MNMAFFNGAVGAIQQQQRMNVQANNISNVNNYGFKAERATFHHLMYGNVTGIDEERLPKGAGTKMAKASIDFSNDGYLETGRLFDFAIEGKGFFALFDQESGEISYTRDGAFVMAYFPFDEGENETGELPDGEWSRLLLEDYRKFLLETYITQPQEGLGPFLTELASSGGQVPGTDFLTSEGWGQSKSGVKNHFLTVFLPQARAMVVIRSCSSKKSVTWEELERYIDGCVRPLLSGLQVDAR